MQTLSIDLLRQVVDPEIEGFTPALLKTGASPSTVYRLTLHYGPGRQGIRSLIWKSVAPDWPGDAHGADREYLFYSTLYPSLEFPRLRVYHAGVEPGTGTRTILLEDISERVRFPAPAHLWTQEEMRRIVRAYARLHVAGHHCLPPEEDRAWLYRMALQKKRWQPEELLAKIGALIERGRWSPVAGVGRLVERTLAGIADFSGLPATLLHNDVYPPNIGLPPNLDSDAILLDWEMVGSGPGQLDMAFLFLQPFQSTRCLDRTEALDDYWQQRLRLEGAVPPAGEREEIQRYADAFWALSLVPVAHKVASRPYAPGSAPAAYWDAMFGVLEDRLRDLCG